MSTTVPNDPAPLVHNKYPHNGDLHQLTPEGGYIINVWYDHVLPNGRVASCVWLYDGPDMMRRMIVVIDRNDPDVEYTARNVRLGSPCSYKTLEFMDEMAAL